MVNLCLVIIGYERLILRMARDYRLSTAARRANYRMFRYMGLSTLPYFVVYSRGKGTANQTG